MTEIDDASIERVQHIQSLRTMVTADQTINDEQTAQCYDFLNKTASCLKLTTRCSQCTINTYLLTYIRPCFPNAQQPNGKKTLERNFHTLTLITNQPGLALNFLNRNRTAIKSLQDRRRH